MVPYSASKGLPRAEPSEGKFNDGEINGSYQDLARNVANRAICLPNHSRVNETLKELPRHDNPPTTTPPEEVYDVYFVDLRHRQPIWPPAGPPPQKEKP